MVYAPPPPLLTQKTKGYFCFIFFLSAAFPYPRAFCPTPFSPLVFCPLSRCLSSLLHFSFIIIFRSFSTLIKFSQLRVRAVWVQKSGPATHSGNEAAVYEKQASSPILFKREIPQLASYFCAP